MGPPRGGPAGVRSAKPGVVALRDKGGRTAERGAVAQAKGGRPAKQGAVALHEAGCDRGAVRVGRA
jgi:hypothetical protein